MISLFCDLMAMSFINLGKIQERLLFGGNLGSILDNVEFEVLIGFF